MTLMLSFLGWPELVVLFVMLPVALALFGFWVWMLIDAIQNRGLTDGERIAWVLVIVFVHALGALLYLLIGRPKRNHVINRPPVAKH